MSSFLTKIGQFKDQGERLIDVETYVTSGERKWAGVFRAGNWTQNFVHDVSPANFFQQLNDPANKVRFVGVIIPGGEILEFSPPMKKLMILGEKARGLLQARLGDQRIQNEVAVILGAIGDETTVPALIQVYPEGDIRKAKKDSPEYLKGVYLTFALTYLTGQPIGRSRWGADLKPENSKLWKDWWAKEGKTFKVPARKPAATWVPEYPILTE